MKAPEAGSLVLLVSKDRKSLIVRLISGATVQTHHGVVQHDDLIGRAWGSRVHSHLGYPYVVLPPTTDDIVRSLKRTTQIIFPKDAGYVLLKLGIRPGMRVVEAGTGSGAFTIVLAMAVMPTGRVHSYELRPETYNLAAKNLNQLGLLDFVDLKQRDIAEGIDETDADALFYDMAEPWQYLPQAHAALCGGAPLAAILPTVNQVARLVDALQVSGFGFVEVEELLLRAYKPVPGRLRPMDRMVAHTGYLVFARSMVAEATPESSSGDPANLSPDRKGDA